MSTEICTVPTCSTPPSSAATNVSNIINTPNPTATIQCTGIRRQQSTDNGGGKCDCPRCLSVCLSVCLLARLLKNACMDLDDILRVDRCRDMVEPINF